MKLQSLVILSILFVTATTSNAQAPPAQEGSFNRAVNSVQQQLEDSLAELNQLREQVVQEKIPLSRRLKTLEDKLSKSRAEYQQRSRMLDRSALDLTNLRTEIKSRQEESTYLSNLLGEYVRNFESRLHIAELQRYRYTLDDARLAPENSNLSKQDVYETQAYLVTISLDRLHEALGGTRFEGTAVDPDGVVQSGAFALVGPAGLFRSADGQHVGTAEQRLGSLEPTIVPFSEPEDQIAAAQLMTTSVGDFPLDPTLGNAHKIAATQETLLEHIQKGGPVMVPIFVLAGAALLVALYKWGSFLFIRKPARKPMRDLLDAVADHDYPAAEQAAQRVGGPVGTMLTVGTQHIQEPRDLIEEIMYEEVLTTRLRLQRMLPFIAICAAAAPLLGLLGTVTGIINTFKLITVFGTGDVKTLSGGISEALITTKFGLIVAIPSLLLHAFLSRKAKGVIDQMEKAAIAFANQVSKARHGRHHDRDQSGASVPFASPPPELATVAHGERGHPPASSSNGGTARVSVPSQAQTPSELPESKAIPEDTIG